MLLALGEVSGDLNGVVVGQATAQAVLENLLGLTVHGFDRGEGPTVVAAPDGVLVGVQHEQRGLANPGRGGGEAHRCDGLLRAVDAHHNLPVPGILLVGLRGLEARLQGDDHERSAGVLRAGLTHGAKQLTLQRSPPAGARDKHPPISCTVDEGFRGMTVSDLDAHLGVLVPAVLRGGANIGDNVLQDLVLEVRYCLHLTHAFEFAQVR